MNLKELRKRIDKIDSKIIEFLNERAKIALEVAKVKSNKKESSYSPHREKEVYNKLLKENKGLFPDEALLSVYREIISASRSLRRKIRIAYWGPEATFTHLASIQKFGSSAEHIPVKSISDIFTEVERGRVDYGVVPIENSTEGVINYTLDNFIDSDLKICSEILLKISHNVLSKTDSLLKIKKLYFNQQPYAQSRIWVEDNLPNVKLVEVSTSAEAARLASKDKNSAAIASELAARIYNLKILAKSIEDQKDNYTRFLVIGKKSADRSGHDKTSIMFSIKDRVGALHAMLEPFQKYKISLTSIESRPSREKIWDYYFFIDFIGHVKDRKVKLALSELEKKCIFLKILGSYPISE